MAMDEWPSLPETHSRGSGFLYVRGVVSPVSATRDPAGERSLATPGADQGHGDRPRRVRGVVVGVGAAALAYVGLGLPVLAGPLAVVLTMVLLALVPVSPSLAGRVALIGSLTIGWLPMLWLAPWPVSFSHAGVVLALAFGGLLTSLAGRARPLVAARRLLPTVAAADLLPLLGGMLALGVMANWAFAQTPKRALVVLLPGADNFSHFTMFAGIKAYGATLGSLGWSPDGSHWAFHIYPQGFHALAASFSEVMHPRLATGPETLPAYTQAVAAIIVLGVVVMTAAIVSVPDLRHRLGIAVPAVVVTWAAFLGQLGQNTLADGFANFWLGAAAAGTALVLTLSMPRPTSLPHLAAIGGLVVACAHTWAPLLILALPAVLAFGVLHPQRTWSSASRWTATLGVVLTLASVAGVGVAVALLLRTVPVSVLNSTGALHASWPVPTFALLIVALYGCLRYPSAVGRRSRTGKALPAPGRVRALALAPLGGLAVLTAFLVAQLQMIGTTAYYFLKLFVGVELVMAVLAPAVLALLLYATAPRLHSRAGAVLATAATLAATQSFGWFPQGTMPLFSESGDGTAPVGAPLSRSGIADGILAAAAGTRADETLTVEYFPLGRASTAKPFYADGWYHAVQHSLSEQVSNRYQTWRVPVHSLDRAAELIAATLHAEPEVRVVVDPRFVEPLRKRIRSPELAARLIPWTSGQPGPR